MKRHMTLACLALLALGAQAQQGGITPEMLSQIKETYRHTSADKAIHNALAGTSIAILARNQERLADFDTHFSNQNYCFFYDQLEKANLFLQGIIDTSGKPADD